jgi:hypothetical protein
MRAKQEEFVNTELGQLRDRSLYFKEHQRQNAHRNVREFALNIDGDIDHYYKSVIVSKQKLPDAKRVWCILAMLWLSVLRN